MTRCILLLALLATSRAWVLKSNVDQVTRRGSSSPQQVQLICQQDIHPGKNLKTIFKIRIIKFDPFLSKTTLAEIKSNTIFKENDDIIVTGNITRTGKTFLKVTWSTMDMETAGAYRCEVFGYDESDTFVTIDVKPIQIREKILSVDDVNTLIQSAMSVSEKKQQTLEVEIQRLKTFINDDLKMVKQSIEDYVQEFRSNISSLNEKLETKYAEKKDIKLHTSELKNFVTSQMDSDNRRDEREHNALFNSIQAINNATKATFLEISSKLSNVTSQLYSQIDSKFHRNEIAIKTLQSTLANSDETMNSFDAKYRNVTDDLRNDLKKLSDNVCLCPTTLVITSTKSTTIPTSTTSTTIPTTTKSTTIPTTTKVPTLTTTTETAIVTTTPIAAIEWPGGKYGLIKSPHGCPHLNEGKAFVDDMPIINGVLFRVQSGTSETEVSECSQFNYSPTLWPKGTYCILMGTGTPTCPSGFRNGQIEFLLRGRRKDSYRLHSCCRSDGLADTEIKLPTEIPFYLFRFRGYCQTVKGMHYKQSIIKAIVFTNYELTFKFSGLHPDIVDQKNVALCHYTKTS